MRFSALLLSSMLCLPLLAGCKRDPAQPQSAEAAVPTAAAVPAPAALKLDDLVVGTGEPIADGQVAIVHYTGWLYDPAAPEQKGTQFDTSRDKDDPFRFTVGAHQVIEGWDQGVVGMQVGGKRRLTVPPTLGYGDKGSDPIPPNATLLFDVDLLGIEPSSAPPQ